MSCEKVPFIRRALRSYDYVLWLDADVVVLEPSQNPIDSMPEGCFQALALTEIAGSVLSAVGDEHARGV